MLRGAPPMGKKVAREAANEACIGGMRNAARAAARLTPERAAAAATTRLLLDWARASPLLALVEGALQGKSLSKDAPVSVQDLRGSLYQA